MKMLQNGCRRVGEILLIPMILCFLLGGLWTSLGWGLLLVFGQCIVLSLVAERISQDEERTPVDSKSNQNQDSILTKEKTIYESELEELIKKYDESS